MGNVERVPQHGDIQVENHGSIYLLHAVTDRAHDWLLDHVQEDAMWWGGSALVVEPRYVEEIVNGAIEAGLEVR